jgi:hypothetical protein
MDLGDWKSFRQRYLPPVYFAVGFALLMSVLCYTDGLRNPSGVWDAVRTFFVYQTEAGHDKAFAYYWEMLVVPAKRGIWWFETPVLVLAVVAVLRTGWSGAFRVRGKAAWVIHFLALATVFHWLIYSVISYKTPWLMCLPWAHVCVLAGLSFQGFRKWGISVKVVAVLVLLAVVGQQIRLTRFATGRFVSDARNPYAYTPTSRDVETVEQWLLELSQTQAPGTLEPIGVVGTYYWPLPWYLREFDSIGYWPTPDPAVRQCPVVFVMPKFSDTVKHELKTTHIPFTRTLRTGVPVTMFLRKDLWERWMHSEEEAP